MAGYEKIEEVRKVSNASSARDVEEIDLQQEERVAPNKEKFEELLDQNRGLQVAETRHVESTKVSLVDEVSKLNRKVDSLKGVSQQDFLAQAGDVLKQIDELKSRLDKPGLHLQQDSQNALKNKLEHVDNNLKVALDQAGVEYKSPEVNKIENPIERFLGFLTDGQNKLSTLANDVNTMHLRRDQISPATMLQMQVKVGLIQQELEFFTSVLNKALESTKTIMNVQV